ncbi:hypothetical protein [Maribacter sp. R77961]|uniref:hypothetical protein n=1 Tax=Maribacter sp. R77961 TaxID=3093871 RepID=UPI0037C5F604
MKRLIALCFGLVLACSDDLPDDSTLSSYLDANEIVIDNVIACAASNQNDSLVSVFLYPRPGVTNIQYFEAFGDDSQKNDFEAYERKALPLLDVFNGFLKKFEVTITEEKWVIVSFEEDEKVHLSNPIRIKNSSKPTEYIATNVSVESNTINPLITWEDGLYDDTKIYFQVITDADDTLISGTYTFDKFFRFYELENVVLNITPDTPDDLKPNVTYGFTLLAVSEDNWVNLFSVKNFTP